MYRKAGIFTLILFCIINLQSQTKNILFLGNSYTFVNDLPQTLAYVATSAGKTLNFDSNAPGGYTLQGHSTNAQSLAKIAAGNWDFVVLQEQSQLPSFPDFQVFSDVFPYARILDSLINVSNPCTETVFFMTWGRKNGDSYNCPNWPPVCTYLGMDSLLNLRYSMMADSNQAILSPVGAVWRYIRQNYPQIELYQSDESHPSEAGTYAAACCFFTVVFREDPLLITYNSTLNNADAANIRNACRQVVYNNLLSFHVGEYDPQAVFSYQSQGNNIIFTNNSLNADTYKWSFGDGDFSTVANPVHNYSLTGSYQVKLTAERCGMQDTLTQLINIISTDISNNPDENDIKIFPNPAQNELNINFIGDYYKLNYYISDISGKEILSGMINQKLSTINIASLSKGLYFIRLTDISNLSKVYKFRVLR